MVKQKMSINEAISLLKYDFYKTRPMLKVSVDADALGILLEEYDDLKFRMDGLLK